MDTALKEHLDRTPGLSNKAIQPDDWEHRFYEAWIEFKVKFKRRVSAYVVDWSEFKYSASQDRTPGLSNKAIQPDDWEHRFYEVIDTALKDFAIREFSLSNEPTSKLEWQL
ncbi:hypothetical protein SUGI_0754560 [Cryptomeria japonica]|nr:hypothetical protein SUGI_0754560 [Cryptomeria japonica]